MIRFVFLLDQQRREEKEIQQNEDYTESTAARVPRLGTHEEMKCIFWAGLHVMLEQDHHLFSTLPTTPHCAATAKARLSSPLFCASTAKGGKAWAAAERWLGLSVSRPSDNSVQWTSESKVLQRMYQRRSSFIKEICFLATNLGIPCKQTAPFIATVDPRSKCSTAASWNNTSSHVPYWQFNKAIYELDCIVFTDPCLHPHPL